MKHFLTLMHYVLYSKSSFIAAVFLSILRKLADLAPPVLIGIVINLVVYKESSFVASLGITEIKWQLVFITLLTFVLWVSESFFDYMSQVKWRSISQKVQHKLRIKSYKHLQELDSQFFLDNQRGNLSNIMTHDINTLENFISHFFHEILMLLVTILVIGGVFLYSVGPMAWLVVIPMPFIVIVSRKYQKFIAPKYDNIRTALASLTSQIIANIDGMITIKSYNKQTYEYNRIHNLSSDYLKKNLSAIRLSSGFIPIIRMVIVVGYVTILLISSNMALSGDLNLGVFATLMYLCERIFWPLVSVGQLFDEFQKVLASFRRLSTVIDHKSEPGREAEPYTTTTAPTIEFEDITVTFDNNMTVLNKVNLSVKSGETVGIIGKTGSGKSTLGKLLLQFQKWSSGDIYINNRHAKLLGPKNIRNLITYISQDTFIFNGTILENINYGSHCDDMNKIIAAAKIAEIHDYIESLPDGYNTIIGEEGQVLSGGEKQRIAIARGVLKDSPAYILDEATSALDSKTQEAIRNNLAQFLKNKTALIITHRLSTIKDVGRTYRIENGLILNYCNDKSIYPLDKNIIR